MAASQANHPPLQQQQQQGTSGEQPAAASTQTAQEQNPHAKIQMAASQANHPPMQQQQQQPTQQGASGEQQAAAPSQTTQQNPHASDPVNKARNFMAQLKESLAKLMKVAAATFQNAVDSESKAKDDPNQAQFDKCLEEFYAVCDQIEIHLKLSLECAIHTAESHRHTPLPQTAKPNSLDTQMYTQLIGTVKTQISCAQEVHDLLMECSKRLEERKT